MATAKELLEKVHGLYIDSRWDNGLHKSKLDKFTLNEMLKQFYDQLIKEFVSGTMSCDWQDIQFLVDSTMSDIKKKEYVSNLNNAVGTVGRAIRSYYGALGGDICGWAGYYSDLPYVKKITTLLQSKVIFEDMQPIVQSTIENAKQLVEKPLQQEIQEKDKKIQDLTKNVTKIENKLSEQNKMNKMLEANNKAMKKELDKGVVGQVIDKAKEIAKTVVSPKQTAQKAKLLEGLSWLKTQLESLGNIPSKLNELLDYEVKLAGIVATFQDKYGKYKQVETDEFVEGKKGPERAKVAEYAGLDINLLDGAQSAVKELETMIDKIGRGGLVSKRQGDNVALNSIKVSFLVDGDERHMTRTLDEIKNTYVKRYSGIDKQVQQRITAFLKANGKSKMLDALTKILAANQKPDNTIIKMVNSFSGKTNS